MKEPAAAVKSCSASGYTDDPLLGCYRFIKIGVGTHADAAKLCASDGGRLLLINSEEEFQAVQKILSMYIVSENSNIEVHDTVSFLNTQKRYIYFRI